VTNVGPTHLERLGTIERSPRPGRASASAAARRRGRYSHPQRRRRTGPGDGDADASAGCLPMASIPTLTLWAGDIGAMAWTGSASVTIMASRRSTLRCHAGRHSVSHCTVCCVGSAWSLDVMGRRSSPDCTIRRASCGLVAVPGPCESTILDRHVQRQPGIQYRGLEPARRAERPQASSGWATCIVGAFTEEGHRLVGRRAQDVVELLVTVGPLGRMIGRGGPEAGWLRLPFHQVETGAEAQPWYAHWSSRAT